MQKKTKGKYRYLSLVSGSKVEIKVRELQWLIEKDKALKMYDLCASGTLDA